MLEESFWNMRKNPHRIQKRTKQKHGAKKNTGQLAQQKRKLETQILALCTNWNLKRKRP